MTERCDHCRFWALSKYNGGKIGDTYYGIAGHHTDGSMSDCRRHPPIVREPGNWNPLGEAIWPRTCRDSWCGEFQPRQEQEA